MCRRVNFLRNQKIMRLATSDDHGVPHVVPVWYLYDDDTVYIGTNTRTVKVKNVKRTKTAAFCIDEGVRAPIYGIMGRGPAWLILDPIRVGDLAKRILVRYYADIHEKAAQTLYRDTDCIIAIRVDHITEWS